MIFLDFPKIFNRFWHILASGICQNLSTTKSVYMWYSSSCSACWSANLWAVGQARQLGQSLVWISLVRTAFKGALPCTWDWSSPFTWDWGWRLLQLPGKDHFVLPATCRPSMTCQPAGAIFSLNLMCKCNLRLKWDLSAQRPRKDPLSAEIQRQKNNFRPSKFPFRRPPKMLS